MAGQVPRFPPTSSFRPAPPRQGPELRVAAPPLGLVWPVTSNVLGLALVWGSQAAVQGLRVVGGREEAWPPPPPACMRPPGSSG